MTNKQDKMCIELYAGGIFQGYALHVSPTHCFVDSTPYKQDAKRYTSQKTAEKDLLNIDKITKGNLRGVISF